MFTPASATMTDAELEQGRQRSLAAGLCSAEQLTDRDRNILMTNIPWMCSLPAGHDGRHEVHVDYTFTDGRQDYRAMCHFWTSP